jgi:hypothetical protein
MKGGNLRDPHLFTFTFESSTPFTLCRNLWMEAATAYLLQAAASMGPGESSRLGELITSYLALNGKIRRKSAIPRENNLALKQPMGGSIVAQLS